jgi:hypothetical protein
VRWVSNSQLDGSRAPCFKIVLCNPPMNAVSARRGGRLADSCKPLTGCRLKYINSGFGRAPAPIEEAPCHSGESSFKSDVQPDVVGAWWVGEAHIIDASAGDYSTISVIMP